MEETAVSARTRNAGHRRWLRGTTAAVAVLVAVAGAALTPSNAISAPAPVTYPGQSYNTATPKPTADKPQSKLWYADGTWWALMVAAGDDLVHIWELRGDHTWADTGTVVDTRVNTTGDALWIADEQAVVIVSRHPTSAPRVTRFSHDPATGRWARDAGFPVTLNTGGGSESATIAQDSLGRLWITYTRGSRVFVAHSDPDGVNWTSGFRPSGLDTAVKSDDISAVVSFDPSTTVAGDESIGVMWSDQASQVLRFAVHRDSAPNSAWTAETVLAGPGMADDHINVKVTRGAGGDVVLAAVKTSADAVTSNPDATLVGVVSRAPAAAGAGTWSLARAGTLADDHTRPLIQIDERTQTLYFFSTAPVQGGDIYYKQTPLNNISFGPGRGQRFIDFTKVVNDASGSKQPVDAGTDLVVLACSNGVRKYVHGELDLVAL